MATPDGINGSWVHVPYDQPSVEPLRDLNFHCDLSTTSRTPGKSGDRWKWDDLHVRMPCSPKNSGRDRQSRWSIITNVFKNKFYTSGHLLGDAIKWYNKKHAEYWRFNCLEEFSKQNPELFSTVVPDIIYLATELPELIHEPIPILRANHESSVTLNQLQIASLLANAFLCTFPWRNDPNHSGMLPTINFNGLFAQHDQSAVEKIKCIFHYFRRVSKNRECLDHFKRQPGKVTFTRRVLHKNVDWATSTKPLVPMEITDLGNIEEGGKGMLQVDFANKMIGGGILGRGAVQEEIRFAVSPELIVARLFTEELQDNEALVITGTERFNKPSGYAKSFRYDSDIQDDTPFDQDGRRQCSIVAIDAIHLHNPRVQYSSEKVNRELNKAYAGFRAPNNGSNQLSPVATGNWGCGAFNGDPRLKALIQLMAASQAGRPLRYFTHGDKALAKEMVESCGYLDAFGVKTVGALYEKLETVLVYRPTNVLAALSQLLYPDVHMSGFALDQPSTGPGYFEQPQTSNNGPQSNEHRGLWETSQPHQGHQISASTQTRASSPHGKNDDSSMLTLTATKAAPSRLNPNSSVMHADTSESTLKNGKDNPENASVVAEGYPPVKNVSKLITQFESAPAMTTERCRNKKNSIDSRVQIG